MEQRLKPIQKILYGIGDTGFSLTSTIIGAYFAIFLTDVVGISPGIAAIAIFIGRTWDYINDPMVGYISDRTRTRWGRRRPFLLFGALPYAVMFALLWTRPPITDGTTLAIYYAVAYVLYDTSMTFVSMPYFALTPELTEDYDERTSLTTYRMFFSIVGSLIAFTVPIMIIGSMNPENSPRVFLMGLIFAVVSALPLFVVFFSCHERNVFMAQEPQKLRDSFRAALKNRPFIFGAVIFLLTWVSIDILQVGLLYYIKYIVQLEEQSDLLMAAIFVTAIFALPVWNWISRRWNKRAAYVAGIAFWALVQLVLISLNPATSLVFVLILCFLAGIGVGAAHVLPWSILPDAVEWDEWQTGKRHEGMFYSLVTLFQKIASSIAVPLTLIVLEVTGYVPNSAQQPVSALTGIRLILGPIPAALLIIGIVFAILYPLDRDQFRQVVKDLEMRRAAKQTSASGED